MINNNATASTIRSLVWTDQTDNERDGWEMVPRCHGCGAVCSTPRLIARSHKIETHPGCFMARIQNFCSSECFLKVHICGGDLLEGADRQYAYGQQIIREQLERSKRDAAAYRLAVANREAASMLLHASCDGCTSCGGTGVLYINDSSGSFTERCICKTR